MNNLLIRAAVITAIGCAAATAAPVNYTVNISGASAQRTLWESDLEGIATGTYGATADQSTPPVTVCTLIKTAPALSPAVPDLHTLTCTISANRGATPPALPAGLNANDTVTMSYGAEFGSVWGIAPFLPGAVAAGKRSTLLAPGAGAALAGYSRDLDQAPAACVGCLSAPAAIDLSVSDWEPILWANPDNWPVGDGVAVSPAVPAPNGTGVNNVINILSIAGQGAPTLPQLQALETNWFEINGEVFTIVVNNTAAPGNTITNLSTQSLRAIFTGKFKTWAQVPEVGAGGSIVVCRRDHGSGTQVTSSLYFTQTECGGNNGVDFTGAPSGAASPFVSTGNSSLGAN